MSQLLVHPSSTQHQLFVRMPCALPPPPAPTPAPAGLVCRILIGPTFVEVDSDAATEYVDKAKEKLAARLSKSRDRMATLDAGKDKLKAELYDRFGKTINLED